MRTAFVTIGARGDSFTPGVPHDAISDPHDGRHLRIEITVNLRSRACKPVTRLTVGRHRRDSRLRVMAAKTSGMTVWNCLEGALLQPECIAQVLRRLRHVLVVRVALRLICLMTNPAVGCRRLLFLAVPRNADEPRFSKRLVLAHYLEMSFVWKMNSKLADSIPPWPRCVSHVSETRKQESHCVARRNCDMAIRADCGCWSFAGKELWPVTIQTSRMGGKLSNVLESSIAFAHFLPVGGRKLVARITRQLLFCNVISMRKLCVIYARLLLCPVGRTPA